MAAVSFASMNLFMFVQIRSRSEILNAMPTLKWLLLGVSEDVTGQAAGSYKLLIAVRTIELADVGVAAQMNGERRKRRKTKKRKWY